MSSAAKAAMCVGFITVATAGVLFGGDFLSFGGEEASEAVDATGVTANKISAEEIDQYVD